MTEEIAVDALNEEQAREELARLSALLKQANRQYHAEDAPEISDAEYDSAESSVTRRSRRNFRG